MPDFIQSITTRIAEKLDLDIHDEFQLKNILIEELGPLLPEPAETAPPSTLALPHQPPSTPILISDEEDTAPLSLSYSPTSPSLHDLIEIDGFYSDTDDEEEGIRFQEKKRKRKTELREKTRALTRNEWREKQTQELGQITKRWKASSEPDLLDFILKELLPK